MKNSNPVSDLVISVGLGVLVGILILLLFSGCGPAEPDCYDGCNRPVVGEAGEPGKDGKDGAAGSAGPTGAMGEAGAAGKDGQNGANGSDGKNGKDGTAGIDGKDGLPGMDGLDGIAGAEGLPGADGLDGKNGKDGASCGLERRVYKCTSRWLVYEITIVCGEDAEPLTRRAAKLSKLGLDACPPTGTDISHLLVQ